MKNYTRIILGILFSLMIATTSFGDRSTWTAMTGGTVGNWTDAANWGGGVPGSGYTVLLHRATSDGSGTVTSIVNTAGFSVYSILVSNSTGTTVLRVDGTRLDVTSSTATAQRGIIVGKGGVLDVINGAYLVNYGMYANDGGIIKVTGSTVTNLDTGSTTFSIGGAMGSGGKLIVESGTIVSIDGGFNIGATYQGDATFINSYLYKGTSTARQLKIGTGSAAAGSTLNLVGSSYAAVGSLTLAAGSTITIFSGTYDSIGPAIHTNAGTVVVGDDVGTYDATFALTATGGRWVNAGGLGKLITKTDSVIVLGDVTGSIIDNGGDALTINGKLMVNPGTIQFTSTASQIRNFPTLTLASTARFVVDVGTISADRLYAVRSTTDLGTRVELGGSLDVNLLQGLPNSTATFTIMTNAAGSIVGTFANLFTSPELTGDRVQAFLGGVYTGSFQVLVNNIPSGGSTVRLTDFQVIPEPSAMALVGFALTMTVLVIRRRRK